MRKHARMIRETAGEKQNFKASETGIDMQIVLTIQSVNGLLRFFFPLCPHKFSHIFLQNLQVSFSAASSSSWPFDSQLFPPQKISISEQYRSFVYSLLGRYFNCLFLYFLTLLRLSLPVTVNVKTSWWNIIFCEGNAQIAVDFNSSKCHSG